jgi:hypothetical protein
VPKTTRFSINTKRYHYQDFDLLKKHIENHLAVIEATAVDEE